MSLPPRINAATPREALTDFYAATLPTFAVFLVNVAGAGLWDRIRESSQKGMSGIFGSVELRTYCIIGRIMLTFAEEPCWITYIADESAVDRIGLQAALSSADTAVRLMQTVIDLWPGTVEAQRLVFRDNDNISIGI